MLHHFSRSDNDVTITGANLHVVSGSGSTQGTVNGTGNLIIGYNELRGSGDVRTGSHNLVIGQLNNYSSYGGMVVGRYNEISAPYASVNGGSRNTIGGNWDSELGIFVPTSGGIWASISGGSFNVTNGHYSSVSGGLRNFATGDYSSISGGAGVSVSGAYDWAAGSLLEN